jgi:hypothetical protein
MRKVGLNTQLLKMRASFGKGAEKEEEEDDFGWDILVVHFLRLQGELPQAGGKREDPTRIRVDGLGSNIKDRWINVVKNTTEVLHRHVDRDVERSSSPSEKGILFTKVGGPGLEAIRGKLHGKRIVNELLATHSAQAAACLGEIDKVVSATLSKDAREDLGRKGFESGAGWHAEGREVGEGGELDQGVPPTPTRHL